jgi:hypothetical protein
MELSKKLTTFLKIHIDDRQHRKRMSKRKFRMSENNLFKESPVALTAGAPFRHCAGLFRDTCRPVLSVSNDGNLAP